MTDFKTNVLADQWDDFCASVYGSPPEDFALLRHARNAFFSGAAVVFTAVARTRSAQDLANVLQSVQAELETYREELNGRTQVN